MGTDQQVPAFAAKVEDVLERLAAVPETGLSASEVQKRRMTFGRNDLR